jgi:4-oxalocrotonate tautomerase
MPVIQVNMVAGKSEEKIQKMVDDIIDKVSENLEVPKDRIRVLVTEFPKSRWTVGKVSDKS